MSHKVEHNVTYLEHAAYWGGVLVPSLIEEKRHVLAERVAQQAAHVLRLTEHAHLLEDGRC